MWAISFIIVVFEKDLGSALVCFVLFLAMLYIASGKKLYLVVGFGLAAIGCVFLYQFFGHVQIRVNTWLDPFSDASGNGYQLCQTLYSLADGGMVGRRHRQRPRRNIPVVESDFIFAAIAEETGLLGGAAVLLFVFESVHSRFRDRGSREKRRVGYDGRRLHRDHRASGVHHRAALRDSFRLQALPCLSLAKADLPLLASFIGIGLFAAMRRRGHRHQLGSSRRNEPHGPHCAHGSHGRPAETGVLGPRCPGQTSHQYRARVRAHVRGACSEPHLRYGVYGRRVSELPRQQPHAL